jgi:hypothetical protein
MSAYRLKVTVSMFFVLVAVVVVVVFWPRADEPKQLVRPSLRCQRPSNRISQVRMRSDCIRWPFSKPTIPTSRRSLIIEW